ncbi:MAG: 2-hydroxyacyl-CoA dehydratase [Candidatus Helarchaeota archaeon]
MLKDIYVATKFTSDIIKNAIPDTEQVILRSFLDNIIPCLEDYLNKFDEGKPVIGYHFAFPGEIFKTFDCVPIVMEGMPYLTSALLSYGAHEYYDAMIAYGHPFHTCSAQSGTMGATLKNSLNMDVVVCPSGPCDSGVGSYQFYSNLLNIPLVVTDIPFRHDERGYSYYGNQLKLMLEKVGKIIGQEPNYDELRKAIDYANQCTELVSEINTLRRIRPCPIENLFNPISVAATCFMGGREELVKFYKDVLEVAKKRANNGEFVGLENKVRSIWPYMSIFFNVGFSEWMDRKAGFTQLLDIFSYFFFDVTKTSGDLEDLFRELAVKVMEYPMERQSISHAEVFLDDFTTLAKMFDADCAIFTAHLGCKQVLSLDQMIREALRDELGIPSLTIEIDIGDKRYTPIEKIKDKMLEFKKTLF